MDPAHQESRPEEGSLSHMDLGHQGQKEGNHQAGTVLVAGSSAALVADAAGLVAHPGAVVPVAPVVHMLAREPLEAE